MGVQTLIKEFRPLQAPFIKINAEVTINGKINGTPTIKREYTYKVSPSAKKIATYIVNQIFGSDIITRDTDVNWLMPSLRDALEQTIYCKESFICLHKFDNKVYLETLRPNQIFDLVQKYDKLYSGTIVEINGKYELHREFKIEDGKTILNLVAYKVESNNDERQVPLAEYNRVNGTEYKEHYILPYEYVINLDIGEDFFRDSKKLLLEENKVIDTLAEEIEKTKTKIATTQHFQTGNVITNWKPNTSYNVQQLDVGTLKDYFTLMPGDKDHYVFQYLQGDIRVEQYISSFKFYDYQIIQMAGLSPSSFGYEKDAYQNVDNVNLMANASDMTIESIKVQLEGQLNRLFENIVKMQRSQYDITENLLAENMEWNYGDNERLDDQKKLKLLRQIEGVVGIPYEYRVKVVQPLLMKLIDEVDDKTLKDIVEKRNIEQGNVNITYGEL